MTGSNNDKDANVSADDQRDTNADAGGTPKQPVANRVTIRNVTQPGTGFAIVGFHPPQKKQEQ